MIQTKHGTLYLCEIKHTRATIRHYLIDEVEEKIKRLKVPRHTSIRPVLIYIGDIQDEVLGADYFAHVINLERLMEES